MWCMSPKHLEYLEPKFRFHPSYHAQVGLVRRKFDFVGLSAWWDSNGFFHNFDPSFFLAELMRAEVKLCETIYVLYWFMLYHHVSSRIITYHHVSSRIITYYHVLQESMGDAKSMSHSRLTLFATRCQACGNFRQHMSDTLYNHGLKNVTSCTREDLLNGPKNQLGTASLLFFK